MTDAYAGDQLAKAKKTFGLDFPVQKREMTRAFRAMCVSLHPDQGGAAQEFFEMKKLYDAIRDNPRFVAGADSPLRTMSGILLSELGNGLGSTTNGKECADCDGNGYTSQAGRHSIACRRCDYLGFYKGRACRTCGGTKELPLLYDNPCSHHLCSNCNGTGETEMFNPVFTKGVLTGVGKP